MTQISLYEFAQLENATPLEHSPADVLSAAWAEAERVREDARREGEAAGFAQGLADGQERAAPLMDALRTAIDGLERSRDELVEGLVDQAAELSIAIAEQVLSAELSVRRERVVEIARGALRRLAERQRVTLLVSPDDLELLSDQVERLQSELGGIDHLDVQSDRRIQRGGAIARTELGEIDATITAQLQSIREIVTATVAGGSDESLAPGDADAAPVDAVDDAECGDG